MISRPDTLVNAAEWWRGAVMYQVYPRSFADGNGDGVGDLAGVIARLPHIASLGVDGIWICPFFRSPMKDFGYDISDYCAVDPLFGTIDDFKTLLDGAHAHGLRLIVDIVMNHSSDQHPWFVESRSSRNNPKADWYVWADPKPDGTPPNNWLSIFGGSAWQFDVFRGQYYLHNFLKEQPDLNYHNPAVVEAMLDQCRFWLDLGVDGFRLDVINFCMHDRDLRDNPPRGDGGMASQLEFPDAYAMQWHRYDKSQPENFALIRSLRALLDRYPGTMALAEIGDDDSVALAAAYTAAPDLLHTAYSFALMANKGALPGASLFRSVIEQQLAQPGDAWPSWAFSNHDVIRAASRWSGSDFGHDPALSKLLIALLTCLRGTAFLYQGEELGLPEADIAFDDIQDPWGRYLYPRWKGRDGCRTPLPWTATAPARSWLPMPATHLPLSVESQQADPNSVLHATRAFLAWRKQHTALQTGQIRFLDTGRESWLAFVRENEAERIICHFNLSTDPWPMTADMDQGGFAHNIVRTGHALTLGAYGFSCQTLRTGGPL